MCIKEKCTAYHGKRSQKGRIQHPPLVDIRNLCLNEEDIEFVTLEDGEEYFIVRLETSEAEEDGVLTY